MDGCFDFAHHGTGKPEGNPTKQLSSPRSRRRDAASASPWPRALRWRSLRRGHSREQGPHCHEFKGAVCITSCHTFSPFSRPLKSSLQTRCRRRLPLGHQVDPARPVRDVAGLDLALRLLVRRARRRRDERQRRRRLLPLRQGRRPLQDLQAHAPHFHHGPGRAHAAVHARALHQVAPGGARWERGSGERGGTKGAW